MSGASTACVLAYGSPVRLRAADRSLLDCLLERLPPGWSHSDVGAGCRTYRAERESYGPLVVYAGDALLARGPEDYVLSVFQSDLDSHVAEFAPGHVFVHAAVVAWRGRAIVMPGRSLSGKTTLARELVRAGATYYSDEYAVLDEQASVHAFPRPLSIRGAQGRRTAVDPRSLGGPIGESPAPVAVVAVAEFGGAEASWQPRRLAAGAGVLELLAHTVSARREPARALRVLAALAEGAIIVKGRRGDAPAAAAAVLRLAERAPESGSVRG